MRKFKLHIHRDAEETCRAAAEHIAKLIGSVLTSSDRFSVVLAGGSTPKRLYELLAGEPYRDEVDWPRVHFFWGDERPVPPDDPQSNFRMANESLLKPLNIDDSQIHRMPGEEPDLETAAETYQNQIGEVLGTPQMGEPPSFDLVLLGLGEDGHTASLYPATPALLDTRRWVKANKVLKLNSHRLTLTPMIINRSHCIFFLATGKNKSAALAEVLEGPIDTQRLPAQLMQPAHGNVHWFVDESAAAGLKERGEED